MGTPLVALTGAGGIQQLNVSSQINTLKNVKKLTFDVCKSSRFARE